MDDSDSLVRRRPRRSTAGNRMEAALAEMSIEEVQDGEDDRDFVADVGMVVCSHAYIPFLCLVRRRCR
jgi:hypothetical protein